MRRLNPWLIVLFVLALFLMFSQAPGGARATVGYNVFKDLLAQDRIEQVVVRGHLTLAVLLALGSALTSTGSSTPACATSSAPAASVRMARAPDAAASAANVAP